jgi:hypothetical protein
VRFALHDPREAPRQAADFTLGQALSTGRGGKTTQQSHVVA